jgi:cytochrome c oxidase subunit 2
MHLIIASVLVVVVAALLILALEQWGHNLLPIAAARQAEPIDALFDLEFKVIAFLFSLIIVLMGYSMIVFRRKRGDLEDASHVEGNQKLEIVWTVAPLATVLFFAYLGGQGLAETLRVDPYPVQVNVIGQKWSWSFEYPLSQRDAETLGVPAVVSDKLYLPVDKQAMLNLRSLDIIHSFWVPEFRVKQDALPGGREFIRTLRVNPSVTGTYALRCAELCGLQHTTMVADVVVMSQEEYDAWYKAEIARLSDPVAIGEAVYKAKCIACHSLDGTPGVGPTWQGIFGRTEQLTDGTSVTIDEGYILKSILDPNAQIVQGFAPGLMPQTYAQELSELQLSGIIEFMKTLR